MIENHRRTIEFLEQLNVRIGDAEMRRDELFLKNILADELVFRRASGKIVTKDEYLAELVKPENTYEYLVSEAVEIAFNEDSALVSLVVRAKGKRGATEFEGSFQNLRVFVKQAEKWCCVVWFNTRISEKDAES
jgi:Domain of unknown function (DUF4440)